MKFNHIKPPIKMLASIINFHTNWTLDELSSQSLPFNVFLL